MPVRSFLAFAGGWYTFKKCAGRVTRTMNVCVCVYVCCWAWVTALPCPALPRPVRLTVVGHAHRQALYVSLSLFFHFNLLPPPPPCFCCFFVCVSAAPSLSICVFPPCKNIPQIEESTLSLIHLLCNPFFISSSCKPLGKPLLLCCFVVRLLICSFGPKTSS